MTRSRLEHRPSAVGRTGRGVYSSFVSGKGPKASQAHRSDARTIPAADRRRRGTRGGSRHHPSNRPAAAGTYSNSSHWVRQIHVLYSPGQRFGASPGVLLGFELYILDPPGELEADPPLFPGCLAEGLGELTAEVRVEERDGKRFARISMLDRITVSTEGATLLRGADENRLWTAMLAEHLERTTGVGVDFEWETVQGDGIGGDPHVDGRLHPHDGSPWIDLPITQADGSLAGVIGKEDDALDAVSSFQTLQKAIDDRAKKERIWTTDRKARTQLVLVSPVNLRSILARGHPLRSARKPRFCRRLGLHTERASPLRLR